MARAELKDMYGRKISVGDFIIHPTTSRDSGLRTSMITRTNISRNFVEVMGTKVKEVWYPSARCVLIDAEFLPEEIYFGLMDQYNDTVNKGRP